VPLDDDEVPPVVRGAELPVEGEGAECAEAGEVFVLFPERR
jgi:hypothetical protein